MKERRLHVLVVAVLLVVLLRHVALAFFIHPYADDFSYAVAGMRTRLLDRLAQEYASWNGRYFSNILVLRGPLVLGLEKGLALYRLVPVLLLALSWFAYRRFAGALFHGRTSVGGRWAFGLVVLLLFLHGMPDASEGIYWYTGAITYQLPNSLGLLYAANWFHLLRNRRRPIGAWWLMQTLLVIIIAGCNELHMAYLVLFHVAVVVWCQHEAKGMRSTALFMLGISVLCALFVVMAPGNDTRGALFPLRHDVVRTLGFSLAQTGRFLLTWTLQPVFILLTVLFIAWQRTHGPGRWERWKWTALALPVVIVFLAMFVTYWPTGLLGQYRTVNAAYFFFLAAWCLFLKIWASRLGNWLRLHYLTPMTRGVLLGTTLVLFIVSGRDGKLSADLLSGRAARYDAEVHARYISVREAIATSASVLVLPPITDPLNSLVILPLDPSPHHWTNRSFADYFGNAALDITVLPAPAPKE